MKEILSHKKRFSRKQKNSFLLLIEAKLQELGYQTETHKFKGFPTSINLETKHSNPEYIFIAHYDTGTIIPFWMHWLMKLFGINRQLLMLLALIVLPLFSGLFSVGYQKTADIISTFFLVTMASIFFPNKNNFDDNTSGVLSILKTAELLKNRGVNNVKFIFVDNEELGLIGSSAHKKHLSKNGLIPKNCKIISVDCVGGSGTIPLIIQNGKSNYASLFENAIKEEFGTCKVSKMLLPASDNFPFRKYGAINISFVEETIIPNGFYIKNIHSAKDNEIDINKINKLSYVLSQVVQ
ncbi:M28 family peptidase [Wenyingzhuangia sp. IMCC45574]